MHGMVAIFIMVEVLAVVSAIAIGLGGTSVLWMAQTLCYGVIGALTWLGTRRWLSQRGVSDREIWNWDGQCPPPTSRLLSSIALAILCGGALALCARGYVSLLSAWWPEVAKSVARGAEYFSHYPDQRVWLVLLTVICAPLAEEYLFRGLLFRALDREWGGWRALVGSTAFFAIYHPPTSWLPVAALGVLNAWLFRSRGSLWPCVAAHATYNLLVILQ
jgi:membrane protease YdiL (CAAX protease family)